MNVRDRELLGPIIGRTLMEVTQHDPEDFRVTGQWVYLHFDNGYTIAFPIEAKGFTIRDGGDADTPER